MDTRIFTQYFPYPMNIGDDVDVEGVKFYCIIPCNVMGYNNDTKQPIIEDGDGIKEVTIELVKAEDCRTQPQPGLTHVANIYLSKYEKIGIWELKGKTVVKTLIRGDTFIILCDDDTYVKMGSDFDLDTDEKSLRDKLLTIEDLRTLDLVNEVEWGYHLMLIHKASKKSRKLEDEERLTETITRLGKDRVREILEDLV